MKSTTLLLSLILSWTLSFGQYTVENLPNPKTQGQEFYVSDPDHILDVETVFELNNIAVSIDSLTGAEFTIVIVNPPTIEKQLSFVANEKFFKLAVLLVKTGLSNGVSEPLAQSR